METRHTPSFKAKQSALPRGKAQTKLFNEEEIPTAYCSAAGLNACVKASGVQTKPRNAPVNVEYVNHGKGHLVRISIVTIAAKARTERHRIVLQRPESRNATC
jgi:hypothetical protein